MMPQQTTQGEAILMKKSIATIVCAAFILSGPGQLTVFAAANIHAQNAAPIHGPLGAPELAPIAATAIPGALNLGAVVTPAGSVINASSVKPEEGDERIRAGAQA